jgi:hypothetical protein
MALREVSQRRTTTFGVHDCYAHLWIERYDAFLKKLADIGRLRTIGEVADDLFLCGAE